MMPCTQSGSNFSITSSQHRVCSPFPQEYSVYLWPIVIHLSESLVMYTDDVEYADGMQIPRPGGGMHAQCSIHCTVV